MLHIMTVLLESIDHLKMHNYYQYASIINYWHDRHGLYIVTYLVEAQLHV